MQTFLVYILLSSGCLSVAYLFYKALLENRVVLKTIRFYFLLATLISLLAPLSPLGVLRPFVYAATPIITSNSNTIANKGSATYEKASNEVVPPTNTVTESAWNIVPVLFYIYVIVALFFIIRIVHELYLIIDCYRKATKEKKDNVQFVWNHQYKGSFSFFHYIFLNRSFLRDDDLDKVLAHEKVHARQYHSMDVLLMQLLTALMWFNPFIWAMRKAVQLVHEYLADEEVLNAGIDKVQYQQSLLDHVTEATIITISSTFKYSLLKKRFLMMSAKKAAPATKYRILVLIPATALMLLIIACANGQAVTNSPKVVTAVALAKANVLYIGIENPVNISVSGYTSDKINVAIDNGTIAGNNGEYVIKPARPGKAVITVQAEGKEVQKSEFVAKYLPPPVVALAHAPGTSLLQKGGRITKEALLAAGGIVVAVEGADIDIAIKIASFNLSVITNGNEQGKTLASNTGSFTAEQVKLIQSLSKDQKIIIDEITASGPDGKPRKMQVSMVFTIDN